MNLTSFVLIVSRILQNLKWAATTTRPFNLASRLRSTHSIVFRWVQCPAYRTTSPKRLRVCPFISPVGFALCTVCCDFTPFDASSVFLIVTSRNASVLLSTVQIFMFLSLESLTRDPHSFFVLIWRSLSAMAFILHSPTDVPVVMSRRQGRN